MGFKVKTPAATAAPPKEEAAAKPAAAKKVVAKKDPVKTGPDAAPTPDVAETVAAPKTAEQLATEAAAKAPEAGGIVTPRMRSAATKPAAEAGPDDTTAKAEEPSENLEDWTHSGEDAAAMAAAIAAKRDEEREARRKRGYFPNKFELIPPSMDYPNRYQADIIVLDVKMGPALNLHVLKNPRSGRYDVNEPCPKEWDNCPICPPHGERDSVFVALLTVLNLNGYTNKNGDFVPVTKELLVIPSAEQAFFHALARERGEAGLRGLQLTMNRNDRNVSRIGIPSDPRWHTEEALAKFLQENGMWKERRTRPSNEFPEGEVIGPEDWMMHAFTYSDFLHKPSGADLRKRYQNGGAPIGAAASGGDASQWGQGRYEPGAATAPGGANFAADLDDDVPF